MLVGQPQLDAAGRRSSLISAPGLQQDAQPSSQPDFYPPTPGHGATQTSFQASALLSKAGHLCSTTTDAPQYRLRHVIFASRLCKILRFETGQEKHTALQQRQ